MRDAMLLSSNSLALIGNTPMVRLAGPSNETGCDIFAKCVGRFAQRLGDDGVVTPAVEHADGLRALARKYECKGFGHLELVFL